MPFSKSRVMKRLGLVVFSLGFIAMMFGDPFHLFGGFLVLLSIWIDNFVQETIDDHFDDQFGSHPPHGPDLHHAAAETTA